jgi:hypothetical protein
VAEIELGQVLRMRETLAGAADALKPDENSAHALTESYMRLRKEAVRIVEENDLPEEEFLNTFPEIEIADVPDPTMHPRQVLKRAAMRTAQAQQASSLLKQMAGWFDGIVVEQTLQRRLELEAQERIKQERKQPPGFTPPGGGS